MNIRTGSAAVLSLTAALICAACHTSVTFPGAVAAPSGHCSDPNPSYVSLTFAGVVCVHGVSHARQADGSTEGLLPVRLTAVIGNHAA
jgi:hypothetical protein